jgi:hypothetical protein
MSTLALSASFGRLDSGADIVGEMFATAAELFLTYSYARILNTKQ